MKDEDVALRIVRLYFEEVARVGFKRSLNLDQMMGAYFYALKRLKDKDSVLKSLVQKSSNEGKKAHEEKTHLVGSKSSQHTGSEVLSANNTSKVSAANNKSKSQIISEVIEEK